MYMLEYQGESLKKYFLDLKKKGKIMPDGSKFQMSTASKMLGISKQALYDYFKSKNLSNETVRKVLDAFDVKESEIWSRKGLSKEIANSLEMKANIDKLIVDHINSGEIKVTEDGMFVIDPKDLALIQEKAEILGQQTTYDLIGDRKDREVKKSEDTYSQLVRNEIAKDNGNKSNATYIGQINKDKSDADENTRFTEISPGRYRMEVDLVPVYARAGYLLGLGDPTYIEELPKHEITVTKYHKGKYLAFEVAGDSMYDGTINSIPDKSTITGRVINRDLWRTKLHTHTHDYWIFVHKSEGVLVKMIKSQNVETGDVVLESLNPNKDIYPDQVININDVEQILNVVKIEREL